MIKLRYRCKFYYKQSISVKVRIVLSTELFLAVIFNGALDFSNFVKKVVLLQNFFVCPGRGLLPASAAWAGLAAWAEQELPPLKNFRGFFWRETRNEASSVTVVAFAQVFFCRETFVSTKATSHTDQKKP